MTPALHFVAAVRDNDLGVIHVHVGSESGHHVREYEFTVGTSTDALMMAAALNDAFEAGCDYARYQAAREMIRAGNELANDLRSRATAMTPLGVLPDDS